MKKIKQMNNKKLLTDYYWISKWNLLQSAQYYEIPECKHLR